MTGFFQDYLQAGLWGSVIILLVILLRLVFSKAPRSVICVFWLLAGIRFLLPFQIESRFSLQPKFNKASQPFNKPFLYTPIM